MSAPQPRLRPTEPATLVVAWLAAAATGWLLISRFYGALPRITWFPVVVVAGVAVLEAVLAQDTYARVHRKGPAPVLSRLRRGPHPTRPPVQPLVVVRLAVLAKASSVAGALFAGWYGGLLPWLLIEAGRLTQAAAEVAPTIGGLVASLGLLAAALWLERACRVPKPPDDEKKSDDDGK
mgnify:CR=1 FL=1